MKEMIRKLHQENFVNVNYPFNQREKKRTARRNLLEEKYEKLMSSLNGEQKKFFEEWKSLDEDEWSEEVEAFFEQGFRTGALLLIDIYNV